VNYGLEIDIADLCGDHVSWRSIRAMDMGELHVGSNILSVELPYSNSNFTSSFHFSVSKQEKKVQRPPSTG
jgi:hypothetical protein